MGIFDGGMEWIIIIVLIIVLLVGAKKIPELARAIGRARGEYTRGKIEIEKEIMDAEREPSKDAKSEKPVKKEGDIVRAAENLGIDTRGKTEDELKREIAKKMSS